jgi:hypothetical protein
MFCRRDDVIAALAIDEIWADRQVRPTGNKKTAEAVSRRGGSERGGGFVGRIRRRNFS